MDKMKRGVEQVLYTCMKTCVDEELLIVTDSGTVSLGGAFQRGDVGLAGGEIAESAGNVVDAAVVLTGAAL